MEMEIPVLEAREILRKRKAVPEGFQEVDGRIVPLEVPTVTRTTRQKDPQAEWKEELRKRRSRRR